MSETQEEMDRVAAPLRQRVKELEVVLRDLLAACTSNPGAIATADAVNRARRALAGSEELTPKEKK